MIVLKPCVKCGGEPELFHKDLGGRIIPGIRCKSCGYMMRQWFWNEEQVTEKWNTEDREETDDQNKID